MKTRKRLSILCIMLILFVALSASVYGAPEGSVEWENESSTVSVETGILPGGEGGATGENASGTGVTVTPSRVIDWGDGLDVPQREAVEKEAAGG